MRIVKHSLRFTLLLCVALNCYGGNFPYPCYSIIYLLSSDIQLLCLDALFLFNIFNDLFLYYLGILHSWCVCSSSNKSILLFMERSLQLDLEYLNHKNMVIVHVMFTLMCNVIKCNVMKSMFILKRPSIFSKTNNPYNYYSLLLPLKWMPQMTCYPIQCFSVSHGKGKKTFKSNVCQNSFYFI